MQKSPLPDVTITLPSESDIHNWSITITGPQSTPYSNGKFNLSFTFPTNYPFKPPTITFQTKIYHPNISSSTGEICTSLINDEWEPTLNVKYCIDSIMDVLKSPNVDSPLDEDIGKIYREKRGEFEKTAKKWTKDYAM